jgi:hypothetical protein
LIYNSLTNRAEKEMEKAGEDNSTKACLTNNDASD